MSNELKGYTPADEERFIANEVHHSSRSAFERDRARILHSSALRRLEAKTQVLVADFDDFARTRLTHSLEVAQIGRDIGKGLGANPDIVDAACLAHDLGHPPFGHNGEAALNEIADEVGGFEGNAQTFRILTRLEPKVTDSDGHSAGLNLTRATLDAVVKYPWKRGEHLPNHSEGKAIGGNKFNVYDDDFEVFKFVRARTPEEKKYSKCIEAQIMDLSDDIAYAVHDTEDAVVSSGVQLSTMKSKPNQQAVVEIAQSWYGTEFSESELYSALDRLEEMGVLDVEYDGSRRTLADLKNLTSTLIGRFAKGALSATRKQFGDAVNLTRYNGELIVPDFILQEIQILKAFAATFVMHPRNNMTNSQKERDIIYTLFERMKDGIGLTSVFRQEFEAATSRAARLRVVVDQIASMTDRSAKKAAKALV